MKRGGMKGCSDWRVRLYAAAQRKFLYNQLGAVCSGRRVARLGAAGRGCAVRDGMEGREWPAVRWGLVRVWMFGVGVLFAPAYRPDL